MSADGPKQELRWFVERLKTETKCSVMHRDQSVRTQLEKRFHRLFWVHVDFATGGRFVSANGKQCDVDIKAVADFLEPGEIGSVAAVKNRAAIRRDHKSAKIAMQIRKEPGSPVVTGCE